MNTSILCPIVVSYLENNDQNTKMSAHVCVVKRTIPGNVLYIEPYLIFLCDQINYVVLNYVA